MSIFKILSNKEFDLKTINTEDIQIKKFKPLKQNIQHLSFPVMVNQVFPNGRKYTYPIIPITYFSNFKKAIETDLEIDIIINYCQYTKLKIYVPNEFPEVFELFVEYENVNYVIDDLKVYVVKQMDGFNYSLPPSEFNKIIQFFNKQNKPVNNIFVPFDVKSAFEYIHGPVANYVLPALTGLDEDELKLIRKIKFIDPRTNIVIDAK